MRHIWLDHRNGNDENDGLSKSTAKRSQKEINAMLQSGDTVHADWFDGVTVRAGMRNITFTGEGMIPPTPEEFAAFRRQC